MSNDLEVIVTLQEFEKERDLEKKMNMMFKAQCAQQLHCKGITEGFNERLASLEVLPRFRKTKIAGGIGIGGGLLLLLAEWTECVKALKDFFGGL